MDPQIIKIHGRVTTDENKGVYGLKIEFHTQAKRYRDRLGCAWTTEDGHFRHLVQMDSKSVRKGEEVAYRIEVKDLNGKSLYKSKEDRVLTDQTAIEINVEAPLVESHQSAAIPMEPPESPLVPPHTQATIGKALEDLVQTGVISEAQSDQFQSRLVPSIARFPNAGQEAGRVLRGAPGARERFQIMMQIFKRRINSQIGMRNPGSGSGKAYDINKYIGVVNQGRPFRTAQMVPIIGRQAQKRLILAAMHCAYPDSVAMIANLEAVREQLRGLGVLEFIYRLSIGVLAGNNEHAGFLGGIVGELPPGLLDRDRDWPPFDEIPEIPSDRIHPEEIIPDFGDVPIDPCIREYAEALDGWTEGVGYVISDIVPDQACPGEIIQLRGSGFGQFPGWVRFSKRFASELDDYVDVEPTLWLDDIIHVQVPEDAGCGPIALIIQLGTEVICEQMIEIYKPGQLQEQFGGALPDIKYLHLEPQRLVEYEGNRRHLVLPGEEVTLDWAVCPAPLKETSVSIKVMGITAPLLYTGLPGEGSQTIQIPVFDSTKGLTIVLEAQNRCGISQERIKLVVHRPTKVSIDGIEVTQSTQFFRAEEHMPNQEYVEPDNSIPLIAEKATMVRVFFSAEQVADPAWTVEVDNITVFLMAYQDGQALMDSPIMKTDMEADCDNSVPGQRDVGWINRAHFVFPTYWLPAGSPVTFTAWLSLPEDDLDEFDPLPISTKPLTVTRAEPLHVVIIRINYNGIGYPSWEDCIRDLETARACFPTHAVEYMNVRAEHRSIEMDGDLTTRDGWNEVWHRIHKIASDYSGDSRVIYCGVINDAAEIDEIGGVGGPGWNALGVICFCEGYTEAAHEIGHVFGLKDDPNDLPDYGYPNRWSMGEYGMDLAINYASLPEYGINLNGGYAKSPEHYCDLMSSEGHNWFSPYHYMALFRRFTAFFSFLEQLAEESSNTNIIRKRNVPIEQIIVCGEIATQMNNVKLQPLYHDIDRHHWSHGPETGYMMVLLDVKNKILKSEPIRQYGPQVEDKVTIAQSIRYHPNAAALEVRHGAETIARIERPEGRPVLSSLKVKDSKTGYQLSWKGAHPKKEKLFYGVKQTHDGGKTWFTLAKPLRKPRFEIGKEQLVAGEECFFRVYASDGFNTTTLDSEPFSLPLRPPMVVPVNFSDGVRLLANSIVDLKVAVISEQFRPIPKESIRWLNNQGELLGTGPELRLKPVLGSNHLCVVVEDGPNCVSDLDFSIIGVEGFENKVQNNKESL